MKRLALGLLLVLLASPAGAATNYVRYVNTASTAGGDCTSNLTTGATRACASLNDAEALGGVASQPPLDLTAASDTYTINCDADSPYTADTTSVGVGGWTADADNYITIQADADNRAGLSWSTSKYRIEITNPSTSALEVSGAAYTRVIGLQLKVVAVNAANKYTVASPPYVLDSCFLWRAASLSANAASNYFLNSSGTYHVINCVFLMPTATSGTGLSNLRNVGATDLRVYSSTLIGSRYGFFNSSGTMNAKNCYSGNSGTTDYVVSAGTFNRTNCSSEDTSADGTNPVESVAYSASAGAYFASVTGDAEDFNISTSSSLYNAGVDTSGESAPLNFTDDMESDARSTWDIGADEYVAPPAGGVYQPAIGAGFGRGIGGGIR